MRTLLPLLLLAAAGAPLHAQEPSPYVPLHWWGTAYVEHLIARGGVKDPAPLTRPLRQADVIAALDAADTTALTGAERAVVRRMRAELAPRYRGNGARARMDGWARGSAASHARRDPLRPAGADHGNVAGGLGLELSFGPVIAVTHPYFDTRLKWDPDYQGKKDRVVAGRNAEAYGSFEWRFGDLFFGAVDRNWGPPALEGLLVSPSPYGYDHFAVTLGTTSVRLEGLITQLDDLPDTSGTINQRHFVAHRVIVRPAGPTTIALWEGTLLAGPGRQLEPWFANIFTLGVLAQYDQGSSPNNLLGADVETRVGRTQLFASVLIDDIQVDDESAGDQEPPSYGVALGARGGVGPLAWTGFYTRVTNLAYRAHSSVETVMRRGVGLARNFSDYDQLTLKASLLTAHRALLTPEVTLLRQGEGDFRLPYPSVAAYDSTPTFLSGIVERTVRLAVGYQLSAGSWHVTGDGGVHLVRNAGHVSGASRTRWVGSIGVMYRFGKESLIP